MVTYSKLAKFYQKDVTYTPKYEVFSNGRLSRGLPGGFWMVSTRVWIVFPVGQIFRMDTIKGWPAYGLVIEIQMVGNLWLVKIYFGSLSEVNVTRSITCLIFCYFQNNYFQNS